MNPPDLGEHAAVRQAEAEAEQPEAELGGEERGERRVRGASMKALLSFLHALAFRVCCYSGCFDCSARLSCLFIWFILRFAISGICNFIPLEQNYVDNQL